jgi:hypothetical protein
MLRMGRVRHWLALGTLTGCSVAINVTGCGGSTSINNGTGGDGGAEASEDGSYDGGQDGSQGTSSGSSSSGAGSSSSGGGNGADTGASSSSGSSGATSSGSGSGSSGSGSSGASSSSSSSGGGSDAGSDASDAAAGCTSGTACSVGNVNGVCVAGACAPCNGGTTSIGTDSGCTAAYGGLSNPYVCNAGSCEAGNCTASSACSAPTPTCGFSTPNFCGGCTSDGQCAAGKVCATAPGGGAAQGFCVSASAAGCGSGTGACPINPSDECCTGSCYPGNCCVIGGSPVGCSGAGVACAPDTPGETTGGGTCTTCAAVSGASPVYYVDPLHGSDSQGTGNNSVTASCAFQTLTRALQVIGTSPQPNTTIDVVGGTGVTVHGVATGTPAAGQELFPLTIRSNITVTTSAGPVTVQVPARGTGNPTIGLVLSGNPSAIVGGSGAALTIDGQTQTANAGVEVLTTGATVSNVTIQNFLTAGVEVTNSGAAASALTIGAGARLMGNRGDGLLVQGTSTATVNVTSGAPVHFDNNGAHGVRVIGTGVVSLTGSVGANPPSTSTVVAQGNGAAGIWVQTTSSTQSTLTGIVSTGSTGGNGIRILPGSSVKVRGSWLLGNSQGSGIDVENNGGGTVTSVANIDLGTGASPGGNTLQAVSGMNPNGVAGICMRLPAAATTASLSAEGNVFRSTNCATAAGPLVTAANLSCGGGADVGGTIVATSAMTGNKIDVTMCTVP